MIKIAVVPLVFAALLMAGCAAAVMSGAASGDRGAQTTALDSRLVREIRTAIYRDPVLGDQSIQVSSHNGVVTLRGIVDDRLHIDRAMNIARNVAGVRGVNMALSARK